MNHVTFHLQSSRNKGNKDLPNELAIDVEKLTILQFSRTIAEVVDVPAFGLHFSEKQDSLPLSIFDTINSTDIWYWVEIQPIYTKSEYSVSLWFPDSNTFVPYFEITSPQNLTNEIAASMKIDDFTLLRNGKKVGDLKQISKEHLLLTVKTKQNLESVARMKSIVEEVRYGYMNFQLANKQKSIWWLFLLPPPYEKMEGTNIERRFTYIEIKFYE